MKRFLYLDIIRIIACLMIIAVHAPIPNTGLGNIILSICSGLTAPGIGLFIMVSGFLLLPVTLPTKDFLRKRLGKVIVPTLVWTAVYWLFAPYTDTVGRGLGLSSFLSIPFTPQYNSVLWFMYMLVGLYLLAPILSAWLLKASKREVELYLGLWAVTMCYPLIRSIVMVNEGNTGILYYFGGYAGYFLLGYYLKRFTIRTTLWKCLLLFAIPLGIEVAVKIWDIKVDFYDFFWLLSILVAMMCVGWFLLIRQYCPQYNAVSKTHRVIVIISDNCFGIYLSHILVMRGLLWHWDVLREMDGGIQIFMTTLLTFLCSLLLTYLVRWLPGAAYIVGFNHKKK